jgi:hypothetical protein
MIAPSSLLMIAFTPHKSKAGAKTAMRDIFENYCLILVSYLKVGKLLDEGSRRTILAFRPDDGQTSGHDHGMDG